MDLTARLKGKRAVVTAAAQGIGRAIGEALLDEGANVCFADINGDKAAEVAAANELRASENGAKVMAATGLSYLAVLVAFGVVTVGRSLVAGSI